MLWVGVTDYPKSRGRELIFLGPRFLIEGVGADCINGCASSVTMRNHFCFFTLFFS